MSAFDRWHGPKDNHAQHPTGTRTAPGRRTLTMGLAARPGAGLDPPVQRAPAAAPRAPVAPAEDPFALHLAHQGVSGGGGALPHGEVIQRSFGPTHDLSGVTAHVGGAAAAASEAIGAEAYATGSHVAFREAPDLRLAAHEAAHVIQQRGGVQLSGGVGAEGDVYERHADEVADAVVRGESAAPLLDRMAGSGGGAAVQRKLTVTGQEYAVFDGADDKARFMEFVAKHHDKRLRDPAYSAAWTVGGLRRYVAAIDGVDLTVDFGEIGGEAARAAQLAIALGGKGLPLFDHPEEVTFGEEEGEGAKGYIAKMVKGLEPTLGEATHATVTTGGLDALEQDPGNLIELKSSEKPSLDRRPGLTILNYARVFYDPDWKTLVVCEVRGNALREQFAMAIQAYGGHMGHKIEVTSVPAKSERLKQNYGRLCEFFADEDEFRLAQTLTFGYANAFVENKQYTVVKHKSRAGWVGTLYQLGKEKESPCVVVLDSDTQSSYHGEILAKNVKKLLASPGGKNIRTVLAGGSAGSLLPSKESNESDHLPPSTIYTPDSIVGPDGVPVENVLAKQGQTSIQGSVHTSVVSALVETPALLQNLNDLGIQTIDMEFGYVAAVVNKTNKSRQQGERVRFGIACLITDYPRTSGGTDLHQKNEKQKQVAKEHFTETIRKSVQQGL